MAFAKHHKEESLFGIREASGGQASFNYRTVAVRTCAVEALKGLQVNQLGAWEEGGQGRAREGGDA